MMAMELELHLNVTILGNFETLGGPCASTWETQLMCVNLL